MTAVKNVTREVGNHGSEVVTVRTGADIVVRVQVSRAGTAVRVTKRNRPNGPTHEMKVVP